jgi:16S rRNA (guanine966-N2)-methyltransferase
LLEKKNIYQIKFDLIFCDPPFKFANIKKLIELIFNSNLLNKDGIIILHRNKTTKEDLSNRFKVIEERMYGISKIIFGRFIS